MVNPELLINTTIDHKYHLHQFLGNGSLGWVYQAQELVSGDFTGSCAVKLLRPKDPDDRSVVLRELMVLARLCHPRLVGLRGSGHISEGPAAGNLYLALELADTTLSRHLQENGPMPEAEVRALIGDLAEALLYLHEQGYVHRDVKPSNIFRIKGAWKLGDFGMVRLKESSGNLAPPILAALGYMAPEGVEGFVGPSLDVWALGAVAQQALTGSLPYGGRTFETLVTEILYQEPHLQSDLPAPFDVIVSRTLVRDRARRWSARDVADALRRNCPPPSAEALVHRGEGHRGVLTAVCWADPLTVMTTSADRSIMVWNADTLTARQPLAAPTALLALAVGTGNVYAGGADGHIYRWEWPSARPIDAFDVGAGIVAALSLSPDGQRLASSTSRGEIDLWETTSTSSVSIVGQARSAIYALAFSPDGAWLVAAGEDQDLHFFDGVSGTWLGSLSGHRGAVRTVAVSLDGLMLASGGDDGTVRVWDIATGTEKWHWEMHGQRVAAVAFRPGDLELASGGEDRTVRRWDLQSGTQLAALEHEAGVSGVCYSPDGHALATACFDRLVRVYPLK